MTVLRFKPTIQSPMERLFNDVANNPVAQKSNKPAVNIQDTEKAILLEMAIPGFAKKDIKIQLEDHILTISSEKDGAKEGGFSRKEFGPTSFQRRFRLPDTVQVDAIKARTENGVLRVTMPKVEIPKPKQIQVA